MKGSEEVVLVVLALGAVWDALRVRRQLRRHRRQLERIAEIARGNRVVRLPVSLQIPDDARSLTETA